MASTKWKREGTRIAAAAAVAAVLALTLPCAHAYAPARVWHLGGRRTAVIARTVIAAQGGMDSSDVPMAKRNALAANRLQWGIAGVPSAPEEQATPAPTVQSKAGLGSELEELVRAARAKAEASPAGSVSDRAPKPANTQRLPLPGFQLPSFGFAGRWVQEGASHMLYPPAGVDPKGVVHFLGGAFVGAAPHLSYRYLLEDIADQGYIIVSTPYNLIFNYVSMCACILRDSRDALSRVPAELPLIGVGHSCGSLMHTLLPVLYPDDCRRCANVLISWNNKPAKEAIPQFEEVIVPFVKTLLDDNAAAADFRENLLRSLEQADEAATELASSQFTPLSFEKELLPLTRQGLKIVEQIPDLLEQVNAGDREFIPRVEECADLLRSRYGVPRSLLISFDDDEIDETDALEALLRLAPGGSSADGAVDSVHRARLTGTHVTPLTQDVFISTPFDSFDPLLPLRRLARQELLRPVDAVSKKLVPFLNEAVSK